MLLLIITYLQKTQVVWCKKNIIGKKESDRRADLTYEKNEKDERDVCFGGSGTGGMFWLIIGVVIIIIKNIIIRINKKL